MNMNQYFSLICIQFYINLNTYHAFMKRILIFVGGFVAGVLLTILIAYLSLSPGKSEDGKIPGVTFFKEKVDCIKINSISKSTEIDVLQVIEPNLALATVNSYNDKNLYEGEIYRDYDMTNDLTVLIVNDKGETFYDEQKIEITQKCLRQVGV